MFQFLISSILHKHCLLKTLSCLFEEFPEEQTVDRIVDAPPEADELSDERDPEAPGPLLTPGPPPHSGRADGDLRNLVFHERLQVRQKPGQQWEISVIAYGSTTYSRIVKILAQWVLLINAFANIMFNFIYNVMVYIHEINING